MNEDIKILNKMIEDKKQLIQGFESVMKEANKEICFYENLIKQLINTPCQLKNVELCMSEHLNPVIREKHDLLEDGQMVAIETIVENKDKLKTNYIKMEENNIRKYLLSKGDFKEEINKIK